MSEINSNNIFDSIQSKRISYYQKAFRSKRFKYLRLAGRGKTSSTYCGTFRKGYICDCHSTIKTRSYSCKKFSCPECYKNASYLTAKRVSERCLAIERMLKRKGFTNIKFRHDSINISRIDSEGNLEILITRRNKVPYDLSDWKDFQRLKRKLIELLKKAGVLGGILVFHPYRLDLKNNILKYFPHFHFFGVRYFPKNKLFKKIVGCNYSYFKGDRNTEDAIVKTVGYELTHAGYFENKHILNWFGAFANNKSIRSEVEQILSPVICEKCEGELHGIVKGVEVKGKLNKLNRNLLRQKRRYFLLLANLQKEYDMKERRISMREIVAEILSIKDRVSLNRKHRLIFKNLEINQEDVLMEVTNIYKLEFKIQPLIFRKRKRLFKKKKKRKKEKINLNFDDKIGATNIQDICTTNNKY